MMAGATGVRDTAIVPRKTATTNTLIVVTAHCMATRIITNKRTVRRMRTDTSRATTAAAAGADTNSTDKLKKAMRRSHGLCSFDALRRRTHICVIFYQTVQRSASERTMGEPSLQLN